MTIRQLKERVAALARKSVRTTTVTMHDKLVQEHVEGYNRALMDVLELLDEMKKDIKDGKDG